MTWDGVYMEDSASASAFWFLFLKPNTAKLQGSSNWCLSFYTISKASEKINTVNSDNSIQM